MHRDSRATATRWTMPAENLGAPAVTLDDGSPEPNFMKLKKSAAVRLSLPAWATWPVATLSAA